MDKTKIFEQVENTITDILKVLDKQKMHISGRGYKQNTLDRQSGLVNKNGIYLFYDDISHRILFDEFDESVLEAYIMIYRKLFKNCEETFAQFALRTLKELGFERIPIIFYKDISLDERNKYKLLIWLADYASLSFGAEESKRDYKRLLNDYRYLLKDKEAEFYDTLPKKIKDLNPVESYKLVKRARGMINSFQSKLLPRIPFLPFVREIYVVAMHSSFSHILHGNILLLKDIFEIKRPDAQKWRVYWLLSL
jgi:hypothetical protein